MRYPDFLELSYFKFINFSIEYKCDPSISFIAFKIIADEPPLATPISTTFFGLTFLTIPFRNFCSFSGKNT